MEDWNYGRMELWKEISNAKQKLSILQNSPTPYSNIPF